MKEGADVLRQWYDIKVRAVFGSEPGDDKDVRILNRVVRWERDRITYEADEKHVHTVTKGMGLQPGSKGSEAPMPKDCDAEDQDQELETDEGRLFRKLVAVWPWTGQTCSSRRVHWAGQRPDQPSGVGRT